MAIRLARSDFPVPGGPVSKIFCNSPPLSLAALRFVMVNYSQCGDSYYNIGWDVVFFGPQVLFSSSKARHQSGVHTVDTASLMDGIETIESVSTDPDMDGPHLMFLITRATCSATVGINIMPSRALVESSFLFMLIILYN